MPTGLHRFHVSGQSHLVTFSCYRRQPYLDPQRCNVLLITLEAMRRRFRLRVYGYVFMPEHVHLLLSEPEVGMLAEAIHFLKLSSAKQFRLPRLAPKTMARTWGTLENCSFWQKRYHDRNVRDDHEFRVKLRYTHRNPVKRGLCERPEDWKWSSFRHYAYGEMGVVEIESEWTAKHRRPLQINPG
jgi:putative transposase